jgi:hypothetical protein
MSKQPRCFVVGDGLEALGHVHCQVKPIMIPQRDSGRDGLGVCPAEGQRGIPAQSARLIRTLWRAPVFRPICRILAPGQGRVANYLRADWAFPRRHRTDADE